MFLPRVIPVLLLKGKGLVKTVKFKNPTYIGDPINAVRIFNDLKADELIFLDITASKEKRLISLELVKEIGDEAFMPFGVGGGISNIHQIEDILKAGAEKVILNTNAFLKPKLIKESSKYFGSQSIVVSIDVKKSIFGKYDIYIFDGSKKVKIDIGEYAKKIEDLGAGEIIINSIDKDGMMNGYDLEIIKFLSEKVNVPVIACGGAGNLIHFKQAFEKGKAHSLAAGSLFVYHGARKAVLINYPTKKELKELFINGITG